MVSKMIHGPRCPNHRVHLVDCNWADKTGICPISSCHFTFDADEYEKTKKLKLNALGQMEEVGDWKVKNTDGGDSC
jgi:hypothetical protein